MIFSLAAESKTLVSIRSGPASVYGIYELDITIEIGLDVFSIVERGSASIASTSRASFNIVARSRACLARQSCSVVTSPLISEFVGASINTETVWVFTQHCLKCGWHLFTTSKLCSPGFVSQISSSVCIGRQCDWQQRRRTVHEEYHG